jgi:hypothetical protein
MENIFSFKTQLKPYYSNNKGGFRFSALIPWALVIPGLLVLLLTVLGSSPVLAEDRMEWACLIYFKSQTKLQITAIH